MQSRHSGVSSSFLSISLPPSLPPSLFPRATPSYFPTKESMTAMTVHIRFSASGKTKLRPWS